MITEEQKLEIVKALTSHTLNSVYNNTLKKMPIIIDNKETVPVDVDSSNPYYEYQNSDTTSEEYERTAETVDTSTGKTSYSTETYQQKFGIKHCKLTVQKKFHFDDRWFSYKYSADEPEFTFGIIQVDNMPYRSFEGRRNKRSFICTMNDIIFNGYCEPFMIFVDRKFVNWNDIHVVFDCDDTYLILYGEKYNYFDLRSAYLQMVILPYHIEFIGKMREDYFDMMYEVTKSCLQDSLKLNSRGEITITIPSIEDHYIYRGMVYNVGAWLYLQQKYAALNLIDRSLINKLKRIDLIKYEYDTAGNVVSSLSTKFNALDKDSYSQELYDRLTSLTVSDYHSKAILIFGSDGLYNKYSIEDCSILALVDDAVAVEASNAEISIKWHTFESDNAIFKENFLCFLNGEFMPEIVDQNMQIYQDKYVNISLPNSENMDVRTELSLCLFKPKDLEHAYQLQDSFYKPFINSRYIQTVMGRFISEADTRFVDLINSNKHYLDYQFNDTDIYEDQLHDNKNIAMAYDVRQFNKLYHTNIECVTYTAEKANSALYARLDYESDTGLKIARSRYGNHETYVLVFANGELIEEYADMIVYPNFFFIPKKFPFPSGTVVELMYINNINNNEITFEMTDYMIDNMRLSDPKWRRTDIFNKFIPDKDLKIFHNYPTSLMEYPTLVSPSDKIAFNISYRHTNGNLYVKRDIVDLKEGNFTAVSSRKFVYQRLYANKKAYRIEIGERFRYCDNMKQYVLFINGRRMDDDTFLVTIPKYSRPFWGMYLYLTKFVGPNDRVDLFYMPEEFNNANTDGQFVLNQNGYIEATRSTLEAPIDSRYYLFFINGKKIPSTSLISIDTNRLRLTEDTKSTNDFVVNKVFTDIIPEITRYLAGVQYTKHDRFVANILSNPESYTLLDYMVNEFTQITDIEEDKTRNNVAKIAIINEIIRDFWVTSGYHYNDEPFVYDYDIDDLYMPTDENGNIISPALDANQFINIMKNEFHLVYFRADADNYVELGSSVDGVVFEWEFCQNLYNETVVISQSFSYMNTKTDIDPELRTWTYDYPITEDVTFTFNASTGYQAVQKKYDIIFGNGIYYGNVDEDILQDVEINNTIVDYTSIVALVPKDGIIPSSTTQEAEDPEETALIYEEQNYVIDQLGVKYIKFIPDNSDVWLETSIATASDLRLYAITPESSEFRDMLFRDNTIEMPNYLPASDFQHILGNINKHVHISPELELTNYVIGNNNYFVYSCPRRLAYDEHSHFMLEFVLPDPNSDDIKAHCRDDKTTPIYTSGEGWDDFQQKNLLIPLDHMEMVYLGDFLYTNANGYTEVYCFWRTNGFFTRLFENYGFNIKIRLKREGQYDDGLGHLIGGE